MCYNKNRKSNKDVKQMENKQAAMSPLADPVVGAIFDGVENAGLAAQSLIGSILEAEGIKIGNVISVTPQKINIPNVGFRATRKEMTTPTTYSRLN
jgi:hypothetical protein